MPDRDTAAFVTARLKELVTRSTGAHVARARDGRVASVAVDVKRALLEQDVLDAVATTFWRRYSGAKALQVAASDALGSVLLGAILRGAPPSVSARGLVVRSERKRQGFGRLVEGEPDPANPCVVVDDLVNSGATLERLCRTLRRLDVAVGEAFVVIDRENPHLPDRMLRLGITVQALVAGSLVGLPSVSERSLPAPPPPLSRIWRRARIGLPIGLSDRHQYLDLADDLIVVSSPFGGIAAVSAQNGEQAWLHPGFMHDAWDKAGGVSIGRELVGTLAGGETAAIDPRSGAPLWRRRFGDGAIGSPIRCGDVVAQAFERKTRNGDAALVRFRADDGSIVSDDVIERPTSNMIATKQGVAIACQGGSVVQIAASGAVARIAVPGLDASWLEPIEGGRHVIAFQQDGAVSAIDLVAGRAEPIGRAAALVERPPLHMGDRLVVPTKRPWLGSIDPASGTIEPTQAFAHGRLLAAPCPFGSGCLAYDSAGWLYGLDVDLNVIWERHLGEGIVSAQVVAPLDALVVLFADASIAAFAIEA